MNVLLDTCALIWLANGDAALGPGARNAIGKASVAHVSAASAWEMGIKLAKGKLEIGMPLDEWWRRAIDRHGLLDLPLDAASAIRASSLPAIHTDPADRLLVATALQHDLTLLTPDPAIRQYPELKTAW